MTFEQQQEAIKLLNKIYSDIDNVRWYESREFEKVKVTWQLIDDFLTVIEAEQQQRKMEEQS